MTAEIPVVGQNPMNLWQYMTWLLCPILL